MPWHLAAKAAFVHHFVDRLRGLTVPSGGIALLAHEWQEFPPIAKNLPLGLRPRFGRSASIFTFPIYKRETRTAFSSRLARRKHEDTGESFAKCAATSRPLNRLGLQSDR